MTEGLGLTHGSVRVVDYDPRWEHAYRRLEAELRRKLGENLADVAHVGSTSVPGLAAKPILDVAVLLAPDASVPKLAGFTYRGDKGSNGGHLFIAELAAKTVTAHIHVIMQGDEQWQHYLAIRDRLRIDPQARADYAELKHRLAEEFPDNRGRYTAAKAEFLARLIASGDSPAHE